MESIKIPATLDIAVQLIKNKITLHQSILIELYKISRNKVLTPNTMSQTAKYPIQKNEVFFASLPFTIAAIVEPLPMKFSVVITIPMISLTEYIIFTIKFHVFYMHNIV